MSFHTLEAVHVLEMGSGDVLLEKTTPLRKFSKQLGGEVHHVGLSVYTSIHLHGTARLPQDDFCEVLCWE